MGNSPRKPDRESCGTRVGEIENETRDTRLRRRVCAGAAFGQDLPCATSDGNGQRATKEFVDNYNAAQRALEVKHWAGAIGGAALARPHAIYGQQLAAVLQIEVAAY